MLSLLLALSLLAADDSRPTVLVVVGAEGTEEFGKQFQEWAERWETAAERGGARFVAIGLVKENGAEDKQRLQQRLSELGGESSAALWLVLIGHGTFDGKTARFNLRGSDVSAAELAEWVKPHERPLAVINCTSASAPFLKELSAENRVVITATKSGQEHNFARFGDYLSAAIADPEADLDKDQQTSLLEAFVLAAAGTEEFYASDARLATEHALIDDNGDGLGTPAAWFRGLRATKAAKDGAALDGLRAGQFHLVPSTAELELPAVARERRDQLEADLAALREQKSMLAEEAYFAQLEKIVVELAELYEKHEKKPAEGDAEAERN
jgi:hypothetical protein